MMPLLRLAGRTDDVKTTYAITALSDEFHLTTEERQELLASGRQTRVANRVYWTFVHLSKAGLLERKGRGLYSITAEGRRVLEENPDRIDLRFLSQYESFRQFRSGGHEPNDGDDPQTVTNGMGESFAPDETETPDEKIDSSFNELNTALRSDLRERILALEPEAFEKLIVEFMRGLKYGAGGLSRHVGGSGDGAIDGIITEDVLGLDVTYLQAKRYTESAIGPDKIREFAGAMDGHGVTKGVFVTTSTFTRSAREYAERSPKHLKLIDGEELTRLMVEHGVGVRTYRTLKLKRLDLDFFSDLEEQ